MQLRPERTSYEAFFADIFSSSGKSFEEPPVAQIDIIDSDLGHRSLTITYGQNQGELPMQVGVPNRGTATVRPIVFTWKIGENKYDCPLLVQNGQIMAPQLPPDVYPALLISSSHVIDASENANRLSELSISKKKKVVLDAIQKIYPQITDLSSEVVGGQQMVYAELSNVDKHLPIQVVSSGINKYLGLILAIHQQQGGVVLIDELENGFYYKDYEKVIRGLTFFCLENQVQLFVSTHSDEMLKAIRNAMEDKEDLMALLRTNCEKGECGVSLISGDAGLAAISEGIELR